MIIIVEYKEKLSDVYVYDWCIDDMENIYDRGTLCAMWNFNCIMYYFILRQNFDYLSLIDCHLTYSSPIQDCSTTSLEKSCFEDHLNPLQCELLNLFFIVKLYLY